MESLFNNLIGGVLWEALLLSFGTVFLLVSLVLAYVLLRQREQRVKLVDPQLGFKVVLQFFFSVSMLLALTGAAMLVGDLLQPEMEAWSNPQRAGIALLIVGGIFTAVHAALLWRVTSNSDLPSAARFFTGWRFAIHGLVVIGSAAWLAVLLMQTDPKTFAERAVISLREHYLYGTLLVWGPSWLVHLAWLWWLTTRPNLAGDATWEAKD
jgi:hypothetical protein